MLKKNFEVGDVVECRLRDAFPVQGEILKVNAHPLEYDMLCVRLTNCVAEGVWRIWVSERDCF